MRIFIAVFVMGAIAVTVGIIVVAEMLAAVLPPLAVIVAAFALLRLTERHRGAASTRQLTTLASNRSIARPPAQAGHHQAARVAGWLIVPISMVPIQASQPLVIDGYLFGKDTARR